MEQSMDLVSKMKSPAAADKTGKVFQLVDEVSGNFKEKLAEAQAKQKPEGKKGYEKTSESNTEKQPVSENTKLNEHSEEIKEPREEQIEEVEKEHESEEPKAEHQLENEEPIDGDEAAQQKQNEDNPEDSDETSQEDLSHEDQSQHEESTSQDEVPEELLQIDNDAPEIEEEVEEHSLEKESPEDKEQSQDQTKNSEESADELNHDAKQGLADGDEVLSTNKDKETPSKIKSESSPSEKLGSADTKENPPLRDFSHAKADNSEKTPQQTTTTKTVEKLVLNEFASKEKLSTEQISARLDVKLDNDTQPTLRQEAQINSESLDEHLLSSKEINHREGVSSGQAISREMQPLSQVLESLNHIANQVQVQHPNLEKLSPQLLSSVKQTYQQINGLIGQALNPSTNAVDNSSQVTRQFSADNASFQSDRLNELKEKVMQQVRYHLRLAMSNGLGEVKMRLNPQFLGGMKVNLILGQNDVSATFLVENQSVKEILQRSLHHLEQTLSERGVDVDRIDVKVSSEDLANDTPNQRSESQEDLKLKRQWIHSFKNFGAIGESLHLEDDASQELTGDQELNIIA